MRLRKFSLCKLLGLLAILMSQSVVAYVPASLMDGSTQKYKTGTINDSGFYYNYWMPTMASNYGSDAAVRESFAPCAIVDSNGDLYAISLYTFTSPGPCFTIYKYVNGSCTKLIKFLPWENISNAIKPNCGTTPNLSNLECDPDLFKNYIHNAFMPCLAQEVDGGSDYLYGFISIPPTRFMSATADTEGMLFFKLKKDGLSGLETKYVAASEFPCFQYSYLRPYNLDVQKWTYKLQPQFGNFSAYYYNGNVHLYNLCNINSEWANLHYTYHNYFNTNENVVSSIQATDRSQYNTTNNLKFIKSGNYIYSMEMRDGYTPFLKMQSSTTDYTVYLKTFCYDFLYLETAAQGHSSSIYNFDYHIFDADSQKKVWCILGFQSSNQYSKLKETEGWSEKFFYNSKISSIHKKYSLLLWSLSTSDTTDKEYNPSPTEYVQNVIYSTNVNSQTATSVTATSADNSNRLYLNTQKMCVYKNYIIYAYCYPGKGNGQGNHLYIGYAPYLITSDARLRLLTKTEFKDASDNSFITDCSRIISLDCKNGHVWLTYMNSDNTAYKYFYIKASDLVGE